MFRSQFSVYQRQVDLNEENRIALLERWKATGAKPEITGWWNVEANVSSASEIKEAIDDTPPGGVCILKPTQDIEIVASSGISLDFENKKIYIYGSDTYSISIVWDKVGFGSIIRGNGVFVFSHIPNINIEITSDVSIASVLVWSTFRYLGEAINILLDFIVADSKLRITDNSGNSVTKELCCSILSIDSTDVVIDSSGASTVKLLGSANAAPMMFNAVRSTLSDENGNALNWGDYIADVVKDANGVPRNIISNIVL